MLNDIPGVSPVDCLKMTAASKQGAVELLQWNRGNTAENNEHTTSLKRWLPWVLSICYNLKYTTLPPQAFEILFSLTCNDSGAFERMETANVFLNK